MTDGCGHMLAVSNVAVSNVAVRIERRLNASGHPFTEMFYTYTEAGVARNACTRVWYATDNSPMAQANEVQAFIRRRRMIDLLT